jgi:hypothetical protein
MVVKARLAWIAVIGCDPIDLVRGGIDPRFDPTVPLLDGGFGDKLGGSFHE